MKKFNFKNFCTLLRKDKIKSILTQSFSPSHLEIINESYKHNMPSDYETHLKVTIVSDNFKNKSTIEVHKSIYSLLSDEMGEKKDNKLHALSLVTKTPEQWTQTQINSNKSPNCFNKIN